MEPSRETYEIIKKLPLRSRVAIGCACSEHLMDLYRFGNVRYTVEDVPELGSAYAADRDLIALGLELAWRFVETGQHDASTVAAIISMLENRPDIEGSKTLSVAANGPIYGVTDSLLSITDETPRSAGFAASRSSTGVSDLASDLDPDEDAPAREE